MSRWRKAAFDAVALMTTVAALHGLVLMGTAMSPPNVALPSDEARTGSRDATRRELGASWARKRGRINEVRLSGGPVDVGAANVRLLYEQQVTIEGDLHRQLHHYVPWWPVRTLVLDIARLRFSHLDDVISNDHRLEIAAQALAFQPDPFASLMGTYQRFVFLHSLYDIMLWFEHSPLVGCTSFVIGPELTAGGHTLVGRNFDFEGPQVLDDHKALFLMLEDGHIPYASVSWPGFVGSVSGMNIEGLAVVIHGARAGQPRTTGEPVVQTVRDLLRGARTTPEALAALSDRDPMVPHMLLIADAAGDAAVVERIPGHPAHVRPRDGPALPLTNHLEGRHADDPKNIDVRLHSSTIPRRRRLDELLARLQPGVGVPQVVDILRDKRGIGDAPLPLGHRSAIDALIATHSIVMDTTGRQIWISEGPHATGRYIRFDLRELLALDYRPDGPADVEAHPGDAIITDGRFDAWKHSGRPHASAQPVLAAP